MKLCRIYALLLALLIAAGAFAACSDSVETASGDTGGSVHETDAETLDLNDRSLVKDGLPGDMDLDGEFVTVYSISPGTQNDFIQGPEEPSGDVVEDAVYARNRSVEERLDCEIDYYVATYTYDQVAANVRKLLQSADDTYDLIIGGQFGLCQLAAEGGFMNALDCEYLDFSRPWWWSSYMEEISIGNTKRFFLVGDYFLDMLQGARVLYFNKVLYEYNYGDPNDLYAETLNGGWTLDRMTGLVKSTYADLNGNAAVDSGDQFGYVTYYTYSSVDAFVFATDIKFTTRDEDGIIELNMVSDRAITLAEKLNALFWNDGSFIYTTEGALNTPKFIAGEALFLGNAVLSTTNELRDMENDFGMLPYPKLDETQENYGTLIHDTMNLGVIPVTTGKLQTIGAVLEALSSESYRSVIPAYYETALKIKYSRDELSAQMIDIIHDAIRTDFTFVYYASLNNAGQIYRTLVTNNSSDFVSTYTKLESGALKALDKLVTAYTENT